MNIRYELNSLQQQLYDILNGLGIGKNPVKYNHNDNHNVRVGFHYTTKLG